MSHSTSRLYTHIIFSVKYTAPLLAPEIRPTVFEEMHRTCHHYYPRCKIVAVNGIANHVHILALIDPKIAVADFVRVIKSHSSRLINRINTGSGRFAWQTGYAAFSCDYRGVGPVRSYIDRQEEHHREQDFSDEFRRILDVHDLCYDDLHENDRLDRIE